MKIQYCFLVFISFVLLFQLHRKINPQEQYINTYCVVGQINRSQLTTNVIDCVMCQLFPLHTLRSGKITIQNGNPHQNASSSKSHVSEIYGFVYMQKTCVDFQCQSLQNNDMFIDNKILSETGFQLYKQISTIKDSNTWQIYFEYTNQIKLQKIVTNIKNNIFRYLLQPILPFSLFPQSYYSGAVIKIRYTQQFHKNAQQIEKPVVKISNHAQNRSDLIILSIIIGFTLATKLSLFAANINIPVKCIILSLGFLSPWLWSILSMIFLANRHPQHFASLLIFICGLSFDSNYFIFISVALSSFIQYDQDSKTTNKKLMFIFNLIVFLSLYFSIQSILSMSVNLFYAFCFQTSLDYKQIKTKDPSKHMIGLQEIDQTHLQDHH